MDSDIPGNPPVASVLAVDTASKGRRAKKTTEKKYWSGTALFWLGVVIVVCGAMISMTLGGNFARICYLVGLLMFIVGIGIETVVIVIRLIRER